MSLPPCPPPPHPLNVVAQLTNNMAWCVSLDLAEILGEILHTTINSFIQIQVFATCRMLQIWDNDTFMTLLAISLGNNLDILKQP